MHTIKIHFCDFGDMQGIAQRFIDILSRSFHIELDSKNPQYLFYSVFGTQHIKYQCVRIFFTGENITPDFNICDYAIGFEHINFLDRYIRYPLYLFYTQDYERALHKHTITADELAQKSRFCNFIVSNGKNAHPLREEAFYALNAIKRVDSGGRYLNNMGAPCADKFALQSECRFSLCFENSSTPGYLTEKLIQAAGARTIPIYWGDTHLEGELLAGGGINENALINVHKFNTLDALVEYVRAVENNPKAQLTILQTPLFKQSNHKEIFDCKLHEFLLHIFSQPYEQAFRRGVCAMRLAREKRYARYLSCIAPLIKLKHFIYTLRATIR